MATFNPDEWQPGFDEFGRACWHNKATKGKVYPQFPPVAPAGLSYGPAPNAAAGAAAPAPHVFNPASGVAAEALWKEAQAKNWTRYERDGDGKPYWHNAMTGVTTWEKPDMNAAGKPPPPPAESKGPHPPAVPKKKEREADQWEQIKPAGGRKYWYNKKTEVSQYDTPDCRRKYR